MTPILSKKEIDARWKKITSIIRRKKVARFSFDNGKSKDVKSLKKNDCGDLIAFRRSAGMFSNAVMWGSSLYTLSEVAK
jgi:hypothetical protein